MLVFARWRGGCLVCSELVCRTSYFRLLSFQVLFLYYNRNLASALNSPTPFHDRSFRRPGEKGPVIIKVFVFCHTLFRSSSLEIMFPAPPRPVHTYSEDIVTVSGISIFSEGWRGTNALGMVIERRKKARYCRCSAAD